MVISSDKKKNIFFKIKKKLGLNGDFSWRKSIVIIRYRFMGSVFFATYCEKPGALKGLVINRNEESYKWENIPSIFDKIKPIADTKTSKGKILFTSMLGTEDSKDLEDTTLCTTYNLITTELILKLRIKSLGLDNQIQVLGKGYFINQQLNNIKRLVNIAKTNCTGFQLLPINLNGHCVGVIICGNQLHYIDPENNTMPDQLKQIFRQTGFKAQKIPSQRQQFAGNCAPTWIETCLMYMGADPFSQTEAVAYHADITIRSKLFQKIFIIACDKQNFLIKRIVKRFFL
ncbi:hypothetical protein RFI_35183 [Reticulomyxa filosa]|uniref:Ubiquitin-like protease family profile domain-containing protein n=1 Tax=Reticulomyxa filosa TaxID=46433 RepID=X6LJW0_RETFI|nr:hypothetical protein RFI_35183 [Reticulomyxa filosa]|eukprot:ETO02253.1 hypothetical protein RFI_35183 [Reticulomyxa filosa]